MIYRPAGYGPAPTVEEETALRAQLGWRATRMTIWLKRSANGEAAVVAHLWTRPNGVALEVHESYPAMAPLVPGGTAWLYCALGPDGLPCAIGTPPETERGRLTRELVDAVQASRAAMNGSARAYFAAEQRRNFATYALADHIIAEVKP